MTQSAHKFLVTFWGTRGSISTPGEKTEKYGGNTPCVSMHIGDTDLVLDAGTGIRNLGLDLMPRAQDKTRKLRVHLLLSHTHWDHIQGLPFFNPAYVAGAEITIYGSPRKGVFLESILQGQMDDNYFPVAMNALAAEMSIIEFSKPTLRIGNANVEWQEQAYHPGGSVRYRITGAGKTVVYATDVELDRLFSPRNNRGTQALRAQYLQFIRNADLLIADGQYTAEEYATKVGWGHTSLPTLMHVALKAGVRQLAVFHHDPQHSDAMLDRLCAEYAVKHASRMNIFWAREGMTLAV